jgi:transcription initiation factor IIE alpha subunit
MVKNLILIELETLTNQGKFKELVDLYITTFLEVQPDPERLRKIRKKVVEKLRARQHAFPKADLTNIKLKVMDDELKLQINMVQNELTRTIILLVTYMVKHGNDKTTKEVFRWVKEHSKDAKQNLLNTIEKGLETKLG